MTLPMKRVFLYLLGAIVIVAALGGFAAFGPPGLYAKSESPEFCGSCHVLQPEYETWFHSGAHQNIKCIDCHLPNDNLAHHLWAKTLEGVGDTLAFHTGRVSDPIKISDSGTRVVVANCRRCHAERMARINEERRCWDCHRRMSHKGTGAIAP
jgi:cytochrome c nitrite reductase small subunit